VKVVFPLYPVRANIIKHLTNLPDDFVVSARLPEGRCFAVGWGGSIHGAKSVAMESGFFWDGMHLDTVGLYKQSSLNTAEGVAQIAKFRPPKQAADVIFGSKLPHSKYRQTNFDVEWDGVVLALENPGDRSILCGASPEDYYDFVYGACKAYQKRLFLKCHPWNSGEVFERLKSYSDEFGCRIEKCNHSVITQCALVLVWNSTFAVDCFIRGVRVAQFAPGYFYQTPAVTYTKGRYPNYVPDTTDDGYRLADFLVWNYCFNIAMPQEKWFGMLRHFRDSSELFPMNEEYCYANNVHWSEK